MSYARTEDGHVYDEQYIMISTLIGTRVIQYSDNPEELCDEFVIRNEMAGKEYNHLVYSYDNWKHYIQCGDSDEIEVPYEGQPLKGAIWTHDGLKYVIERTKEGKWRLI